MTPDPEMSAAQAFLWDRIERLIVAALQVAAADNRGLSELELLKLLHAEMNVIEEDMLRR